MKLKLHLQSPREYHLGDQRELFLVPRDAADVRAVIQAIVDRYSLPSARAVQLRTEDGFSIDPEQSSVILETPKGEAMRLEVVTTAGTAARRRRPRSSKKAAPAPVVLAPPPVLACSVCKEEKARTDFARRQRKRELPVCSCCTRKEQQGAEVH
jgi:hypothetical protein